MTILISDLCLPLLRRTQLLTQEFPSATWESIFQYGCRNECNRGNEDFQVLNILPSFYAPADETHIIRTAEGETPLERSGLSLENISSWTVADVQTALETACPLELRRSLSTHVERLRVDGPYLLAVSEASVAEIFTRSKARTLPILSCPHNPTLAPDVAHGSSWSLC